MKVRLVAVIAALAAACAGCSSVVSGTGHALPGGGRSTPAPAPAPTAPGPSPAARPTGCPHVEYPAARLSFDCITSGMNAFYDGLVWPVSERKVVEQSTNWVLEEGAGHWGSPRGQTLAGIAVNVRQQMINLAGYGADPKVETVASRPMTVDGHAAYLLQTTFTINPQWAQANGTDVKQEKLWIVAIEVGANDVSLWYASVPDLVKELWPKVPAIIAAIKVG